MVKCNTFPQIVTYQNIIMAYRDARRNKQHQKEVSYFSLHAEEEMISIQNDLMWMTYRPGCYRKSIVYEPKKRLISSLPFRDRVVQHAIYRVIQPEIEKSMINDSYACRVGKGSQRGMLRAQSFALSMGDNHYIAKFDFYHYFASIDHDILKQILRRYIRDARVYSLCCLFIPDNEEGVPIGNLLSQLFANMYLNELDHHIRDELGFHCYVRYMDDFVIHVNNRKEAADIISHISHWSWEHLHIRLNSKTQLFPSKQGVNFLGYMVHRKYIKIRHSTVKNIKRKIRRFIRAFDSGEADIMDIRPAMMSWLSMSKWGNCKSIERAVFTILNRDDEGWVTQHWA